MGETEKRKVPLEDQITPSEAFCWASGELARVMVLREAIEIAGIAIKSSMDEAGSSWSPYDEDVKAVREMVRTAIGAANDLFRSRLADWFARFETQQTLNADAVMPPPGQTLRKIREVAMDALDERIRLHLEHQGRIGHPWTGEPYRIILDRMLRTVRFGDRGLSNEQSVIGRPLDNDPAVAKAAQSIANDATHGEGGDR